MLTRTAQPKDQPDAVVMVGTEQGLTFCQHCGRTLGLLLPAYAVAAMQAGVPPAQVLAPSLFADPDEGFTVVLMLTTGLCPDCAEQEQQQQEEEQPDARAQVLALLARLAEQQPEQPAPAVPAMAGGYL